MSDANISRRFLLGNSLLMGGGLLGTASSSKATTTAPFGTVDTFTALASTAGVPNDLVRIKGHTLPGIGGGDFICIDGSAPYPDNGTQINAAGGIYWKRVNYQYLTPEMFGAGVSQDDSSAFNSLSAYGKSGDSIAISLSPVKYKMKSQWTITNRNVFIVGCGPRQSILQFFGCDGINHVGDYVLSIADLGIETDTANTYTGIKYGLSTVNYTQDTIRITNVNMWGTSYGSTYWGTAVAIQDASNIWIDRLTVIGQNITTPHCNGKGVRVLSTIPKPSTGVHFTRCTLNFLETGVEINAAHYPSIEGVRFNYCGFVSVKNGIVFDGSTSGYTPPLLTIFESHIDLADGSTNPIGIRCNQIAQIDIKGCDLYSFVTNGVCIWLTNCTETCIEGNFFIGGGSSLTGMAGILLDTGTNYTTIDNNMFSGGFQNCIYALAVAGPFNRESRNRFASIVTEVLDGSTKLIRESKSKVRLKLNSHYAIPTSTQMAVAWSSADENINTSWAVGSPTKITIDQSIRSVRFCGVVRFATNSAGYRQVILTKNGSFLLGLPIQTMNAINGQPTDISIMSSILDVNAGDYFELSVVQTSGANLNIDSGVSCFIMDIVRTT